MKELFENWRKYTKNLLKENDEKVKAAQEKVSITKNYAQQLVKSATVELNAAKEEAAQQKAAEEAALKSQEIAKTGTSSTKSTVGTVSEFVDETVGYQGVQDGSINNTPISSQEQLNSLKESELTEDMSGEYEGIDEDGVACNVDMMYEERDCGCPEELEEAKYQGRNVTLNKPMRGDVKKFKVFVKDPSTGNVKKVNFGDKKMRIKKSNPARRKSFRARHRCDNPGPKTKARYWSCRKW